MKMNGRIFRLMSVLYFIMACNPRPSKIQRQESLLGLRTVGVTDAGLAAVLKKLRSNPTILDTLPGDVRQDLQRASHRLFDDVKTVIDLPLQSGGEFKWSVLMPDQAMRLFFARCPGYKDLFRRILQNRPSRIDAPWNAIVYWDEVTPGNVLRPDNRRKFSAFYMNFREFGLHIRSEYTWIPIAVIRHTTANTIKGGMPCVMKHLLYEMLLRDSGLPAAGMAVHLVQNSPTLFFARLGNVLGDEASLKMTWGVKGSSGLKPCMLCKNCVMKRLMPHATSDYLIDVSCSHQADFDLATDEDIWETVDMLIAQAPVISKAAMDDLEKATGTHANDDGILRCIALRPHVSPTSSTYDSMHCFFSHGVAANDMHNYLQALATIGLKYQHLREFCQADWRGPRNSRGATLAVAMFTDGREASSKENFKGAASELLAAYPLVQQLVTTAVLPTGKLAKETASFLAMCECVNLLQQIKAMHPVPPSQLVLLRQLQTKHLELFVIAYGVGDCKPKHHYSLHIPDQIERDGLLIDAFALERKHRCMKRHATDTDNTKTFEASVLTKAMIEQLHEMPADFVGGLVGPTAKSVELAASLHLRECTVADELRIGTEKFCANDVLFIEQSAFIVLACLHADTAFQVIVQRWQFVRSLGCGKLWAKTDERFCLRLPAGNVRHASYWTFGDEGMLSLD